MAIVNGETVDGEVRSERSRGLALLLCIFLGALGFHRFYLGQWGSGLIMLLGFCFGLFWVSGIWAFLDAIMLLFGQHRDGDKRLVLRWDIGRSEPQKTV